MPGFLHGLILTLSFTFSSTDCKIPWIRFTQSSAFQMTWRNNSLGEIFAGWRWNQATLMGYTPENLTWNLKRSPQKKEVPLGNHHFQVPAVKFRSGVYILMKKPSLPVIFPPRKNWDHRRSPKINTIQWWTGELLRLQMGISKNRGIPKWMVYNGKPY